MSFLSLCCVSEPPHTFLFCWCCPLAFFFAVAPWIIMITLYNRHRWQQVVSQDFSNPARWMSLCLVPSSNRSMDAVARIYFLPTHGATVRLFHFVEWAVTATKTRTTGRSFSTTLYNWNYYPAVEWIVRPACIWRPSFCIASLSALVFGCNKRGPTETSTHSGIWANDGGEN